MRKVLIIAPLCAILASPVLAAGGAGGGHGGGGHAGASHGGAHAGGAHAGAKGGVSISHGAGAKPGSKPKGAAPNVLAAIHSFHHGPQMAATPVPQ